MTQNGVTATDPADCGQSPGIHRQSVGVEDIDHEIQRGIGRDGHLSGGTVRLVSRSVALIRWNDQQHLRTDGLPSQAVLPSGDDLGERELRG